MGVQKSVFYSKTDGFCNCAFVFSLTLHKGLIMNVFKIFILPNDDSLVKSIENNHKTNGR